MRPTRLSHLRRFPNRVGPYVRFTYIDLFVFSNSEMFVRRVTQAGVTGVVVDWERRGKRRRQAGADTQINRDTPADLAAVRSAAPTAQILCRVNQWSRWTASEIELAISLGADEVLLPMVRRPDEVDAALTAVAGRCGLGILVETTDAVRRVAELVEWPLSRVYVGLNDLMIDRGGGCLFGALVDGTVEHVARATAAANLPFGVAGLTVPEGGHPVPCRLIMGALASLGASFTFLRRSFHADVSGRDVGVEVPRILAAVEGARHRTPTQIGTDAADLAAAVGLLTEDEAV
ncbi:MAG: aldolase/citrate lyase family protein [Acidimicrobiales bacterium]